MGFYECLISIKNFTLYYGYIPYVILSPDDLLDLLTARACARLIKVIFRCYDYNYNKRSKYQYIYYVYDGRSPLYYIYYVYCPNNKVPISYQFVNIKDIKWEEPTRLECFLELMGGPLECINMIYELVAIVFFL